MIVSRMLERAPEGMYFILCGPWQLPTWQSAG